MNLDIHGLPCQSDGNCADQLNRIGLIAIVQKITDQKLIGQQFLKNCLATDLQDQPGVYRRFTFATTKDVTCDQLVPIIAFWLLDQQSAQVNAMGLRMLKAFGFAQNVSRQGEPTTKTLPDFMLFRTAPLFLRGSPAFYPLLLVLDFYLLIMVLSCLFFAYKDPNESDDNNLIVTLLVCRLKLVSPFSLLALFLYKKFRPRNLGNAILGETNHVQGAMSWYHQKANGGNPEIADLWRPIISKYF
jgi:hypothetical protein